MGLHAHLRHVLPQNSVVKLECLTGQLAVPLPQFSRALWVNPHITSQHSTAQFVSQKNVEHSTAQQKKPPLMSHAGLHRQAAILPVCVLNLNLRHALALVDWHNALLPVSPKPPSHTQQPNLQVYACHQQHSSSILIKQTHPPAHL